MSFTQKEAAVLSGYGEDERGFRSLVDSGAVLPTPETRSFGRGKAKQFATEEVLIASMVNQVAPLLNPLERTQFADWLRNQIGAVVSQLDVNRPLYAVLQSSAGYRVQPELLPAERVTIADQYNHDVVDDIRISVLARLPDGSFLPATRLVMVNMTQCVLGFSDHGALREFLHNYELKTEQVTE